MRKFYDNKIDNNLAKMFNTNRDHISNERDRLSSVDDRALDKRRSGMLDFGALQFVNFFDDDEYAVIGSSMSSTIVR